MAFLLLRDSQTQFLARALHLTIASKNYIGRNE